MNKPTFIEIPATQRSISCRKPVHGVGINNADYLTNPRINNRLVACPIYTKWTSMLSRCYSLKYQQKQPTYKDCTVCCEWLTFSNFYDWMKKQDWKNKCLDKDLKTLGNKEYSPENCLFITSRINNLTTDSRKSRGKHKTGVSWHYHTNKFLSSASSVDGKKKHHIGLFDNEDEAYEAYRVYKKKLIIDLSMLPENLYIKQYLINYANSI